MKAFNAATMSVDELWAAHEEIRQALVARIQSEQAKLKGHLARLRSDPMKRPKIQAAAQISPVRRERRPYPKVLPKYRSLENPSETWSGRGKRPRWMIAEMKDGKTVADFLIEKKRPGRRKSPPN
jgi:DNA-binding protein H-NS